MNQSNKSDSSSNKPTVLQVFRSCTQKRHQKGVITSKKSHYLNQYHHYKRMYKSHHFANLHLPLLDPTTVTTHWSDLWRTKWGLLWGPIQSNCQDALWLAECKVQLKLLKQKHISDRLQKVITFQLKRLRGIHVLNRYNTVNFNFGWSKNLS